MIKRAVAAVVGLGLVLSVAGCVSTGHASSLAHRMAVHLPRGPFTVYVLNQGSGTVTAISTATNMAGKPIKVGHSPCSMAVAPDGRAVYVTNQMAGTVTPINTRTNRSGEPIKVGFMASMIVFTPDGKTAYVGTANTVVPFNTVTGAVGRAIRVAPRGDMGAITAMTTTPDGKTAYILLELSRLTAIKTATNQVRTQIGVGKDPTGIAITPGGKKAFVSAYRSNIVMPISIATDTPGKPIAVGKHPAGIAITPDGKTAYVANRASGTVTVIDTRTNVVEKTIKVGKGPWDVLVAR